MSDKKEDIEITDKDLEMVKDFIKDEEDNFKTFSPEIINKIKSEIDKMVSDRDKFLKNKKE